MPYSSKYRRELKQRNRKGKGHPRKVRGGRPVGSMRTAMLNRDEKAARMPCDACISLRPHEGKDIISEKHTQRSSKHPF